MRVLAIDPGREKCGVAVAEQETILERAVIPTGRLVETAKRWVEKYALERILLGNRTGSEEFRELLAAGLREVPVILVPEEETTLAARQRYFREHPPRGWRRLVPLSMQLPPEPYDDYVAVLLIERYFAGLRQ